MPNDQAIKDRLLLQIMQQQGQAPGGIITEGAEGLVFPDIKGHDLSPQMRELTSRVEGLGPLESKYSSRTGERLPERMEGLDIPSMPEELRSKYSVTGMRLPEKERVSPKMQQLLDWVASMPMLKSEYSPITGKRLPKKKKTGLPKPRPDVPIQTVE